MKKFIKIFFIIFVFFNSTFLVSSSWKTFMFDETRKGAKYEVAITSGITPQSWSLNIQGEVVASSVVKDDIVYFASRDGSIWAVDAYKGEILWQYSTSGWIDFTPVLWKDYVYVGSYDGKIYCFKKYYNESEDFAPLWTYDTQSKLVGSLVVVEDEDVVGYESNPWIIFVSGPKTNGLPKGKLYILDALEAKEISVLDLENFSYSSLSYSEGKIYFTTNDGVLQCYDLKQQKFLWQRKFLSCLNHTSAAIKENNIFVYAGDTERKVYMIDKNNGEILWSSQQLSSLATNNTSVTLYEDKILLNIYPTSIWKQDGVVWSSQTVVCISTTTGILWRKDILVKNSPKESYNITSAVSVVSDTAYFGSYSGELFVLNVNTAQEIAKYSFESPILCSVAISNGWVYFSEVKGNFYGVKTEKFLSIKQPDFYDVVINTTTLVVLSLNFAEDVKVEISGNNEEVVISTISLTNKNTVFFDTKSLLDGKYVLKLKDINNIKTYAANNITIDNSPLPPTNLTAFLYEPNKVYLSWTKSYDDGSGNNDVRKYKIYRSLDGQNYSYIAEVPKGTNFYIDSVVLSSTYYYKLTAKDKYSESVFSSLAKLFVETEKITEEKTEEDFLVKAGSECVIEYFYNGRKLELYFGKTSLNNDLTIIISFA
ncbi:MAG: PQQ-binding-like beta-propeller repeat protein, partial [Endomicrobiia bacterium]